MAGFLDWLFNYGHSSLFGVLAIGIGALVAMPAAGRLSDRGKSESLFLVCALIGAELGVSMGGATLDSALSQLAGAIAVVLAALHFSTRPKRSVTGEGAASIVVIGLVLLFSRIYFDQVFYLYGGTAEKVAHPELIGGLLLITLIHVRSLFRREHGWPIRCVGLLILFLLFSMLLPRVSSLYGTWELARSPPTLVTRSLQWIFGGEPSKLFEPSADAKEYLKGAELPLPGIIAACAQFGLAGLSALLALAWNRTQRPREGLFVAAVCCLVPGGFSVPVVVSFLYLLATKDPKSESHASWPASIKVGTAITALAISVVIICALSKARPLQGLEQPTPLSTNCVAAILASEDLLFTEHHGIDWARLKQVTFESLRTRRFERGASTIPMQVAKVQWLYYERTAWRKIQQFILGWYMELRYTKAQILQSYLATIPFGPGQIGIVAAASAYFGTEPEKLSAKQCRLLALSIPEPGAFNPGITPTPPAILSRERNLQLRAARFNSFLTRRIKARGLAS